MIVDSKRSCIAISIRANSCAMLVELAFLFCGYLTCELQTVPTAKHVSSVPNKEGRDQGTMSSSSSLSFESIDVLHCLDHMQLFKPYTIKVMHKVLRDGSLFMLCEFIFSRP